MSWRCSKTLQKSQPQQITDDNMPRSSKRAEAIKNLIQIIRFKIKEASLESLFESDSGPSSDDSDLGELVAALISIKKRRYLAKWNSGCLRNPF
ncbi:uncharacterized protein VP01_935g3 [Puccinia sorghi]|uniref:Uncharacterized protein n=1 Tax=Puccinia sorghi TaxID=27349 RepID=A0A0L6U6W1_9BASI|nr:uncharacterized protein VP01_935g3 [Puccinia sorghi]